MDPGPVRTCVVCRRRGPVAGLVRIRAGGASGSGRGRGAWLCRGRECVAHPRTADILSRALRSPFSGDELEQIRTLPGFSSTTDESRFPGS